MVHARSTACGRARSSSTPPPRNRARPCRFNYRATEYLDQNGWHAFFHWFDYESWYPLGRPVGTTIYPGMQITSVVIKRTLNALGNPISLNDVCCYVPAWCAPRWRV